MSPAKTIYCFVIALFVTLAAPYTQAEVVYYSFEDVQLNNSGAQMFGEFSWTYDVGDFENGVGQFTFLDIPYTIHDHTDLISEFDIGTSIEIVLPGNFHDDGVDITLRLLEALTPTSGSPIDLAESHWEIGGNAFYSGVFVSGSIILSNLAGIEDQAPAPIHTMTTYPNPFNPRTSIVFELNHESAIQLDVYDLSGRLMRRLADGIYPNGMHTVTWDGTDSYGNSLPSGNYFAQVKTGGKTMTRSMTLVK